MSEDFSNANNLAYQKPTSYALDTVVHSWGQTGKRFQAIGVEVFDYSKRAFETSTRAFEQLMGANSPQQVIDIHTRFAQTSFDTYVAQMSKLTEMVADMWRLSEIKIATAPDRSS